MTQELMNYVVGLSEVSRGARPPSVRTHSAIEKLDEVARSRQSGLFQNWTLGLADLQTMGFEIFRMVQPEGRYARMTGTGTGSYTVSLIKEADLIGGIDIAPEPGGTQPKTAIERQAMITTLLQSGLINVQDPRVVHHIYKMFGVAELIPEMDKDLMQISREHDRFRKTGQIQINPWDNHQMHHQQHDELMKSEEFEDWPEEKRQALYQHDMQHNEVIAQQQQAMMEQQAQMAAMQQGAKQQNGTS